MTREEALEILDTIPTIHEQVEALEMAIKALENQKTGHWEYVQYDGNHKIGNYHCSVCRHIIIPFENQKYCPNCGACMKRGDNNE
jgi:rubrerythrin